MAAGKRISGRKLPPPPRPRTTGGKTQGKRQQPSHGSTRRMLQLLVSAAVLVIVVTVKFTMPDVAQQYGGELLRLMGEDTDFVAAFSAAGRAIGGDDPGIERFQRFQKLSQERGLHVIFEVIPGFRHEWRVWEIAIQKALKFFGFSSHDGGNAY